MLSSVDFTCHITEVIQTLPGSPSGMMVLFVTTLVMPETMTLDILIMYLIRPSQKASKLSTAVRHPTRKHLNFKKNLAARKTVKEAQEGYLPK